MTPNVWISVYGMCQQTRTFSSPDLSEVAAALPSLLTELHHILAERLWGNGHLGQQLLIITQEYSHNHL